MKFLLILFMLIPSFIFAQAKNESLMYSSGRIYVVIAVLLIILVGIFLYLIRIERKIKKLEKND